MTSTASTDAAVILAGQAHPPPLTVGTLAGTRLASPVLQLVGSPLACLGASTIPATGAAVKGWAS